ncbi:MAG TPA: histidine kinase [Flavitalea sp.]|nr:histidine kinase [Flavitalea sp.]
MQARFRIPVLFFLACSFAVQAQRPGVMDSLTGILKTAKDDPDKVLLLIAIGQEYESADLDKAKQYYRQARILGKRISYPETESKFISNYTFALNMEGKYDSSLILNLQGIEEAKKLNSKEQLAKAYFNTGTSYNYMSDYSSAVEYYQKGYQLFEELNNRVFLAQASDILQNLYTAMDQYDKALLYGKKAAAEFRTLDNPKMLAYSLNNLGVVYGSMNRKDSAFVYYKEAEQIARTINDEVLISTIEINLGDVNLWKRNLEESRNYYRSVLQTAKKIHLPSDEIIALRGISYCYMYQGDYPMSEQYIRQAVALTGKHPLPRQKALILDQQAALAYLLKDPWKAKQFENEAKSIRDSLMNNQILTHTLNLEKKYELDKKNTQLALQEEKLKRKNATNWILIGGMAVLLIISVLGYRNYSQRKKIQEQRIRELEAEKQLMATQSLLRGQEEERSRIAKDLHDGLGGLLSGVKLQLGAMKGNLILTEENGLAFNGVLVNLEESISEMRRVAHNMMPETLLRFGLPQALLDYSNGLSQQQGFTIQCEFRGMEKRMDNSTELVIYRIVQELINNAVKHSGATTILVQIMRHDEERLNITVEDNGKGFDPKDAGYHSAGLRNIRSRVKYLNGKMDIQSEPGSGASVYIECEIKPYG